MSERMRPTCRDHRRGAAAVEAAFVLPLLVLLAFGFVELGCFVNSDHILHTSARQGARAAVRAENSNAEVEAAVVQALGHETNATASDITVTIHKLDSNGAAEYQVQNLNDNEQGEAVRVTVEVDYVHFGPPSNFLGLAGGRLSASAVMQREK